MCFWPVFFKKGGLKFWVSFTEKYGSPWLIGKHPRGASTTETDALLDTLEAMVQDAVGVIPDDASVEVKEAAGKSGSAEVYERLLMYCRSEVNIALLGQNQTTEASANKASAQAGLEVIRDIRDGDAGIVASTLNTLIRWIGDINFPGAARPLFSLWEQEELDKTLAERDETLSRAGATFTKAYFERAYGLQKGDLAEAGVAPPAVRYLEQKGYKLAWNRQDTLDAAHARAFTVAKVARLDVLQDLHQTEPENGSGIYTSLTDAIPDCAASCLLARSRRA